MGGGVTVTFMSGSDPSIVKTTCPDPLTAPLAKDDPSFVALNRFPAVFPPIVHVIVCVVSLEVCVHAYEDPVDHPLKREMVTRAVPSLFVTVTFETFTGEPEAIRMPALPIVREPPASPRLAVTRVVVPLPPWTRRVPDQTRVFAAIVYVTVDAPPSNVTSTNSALPDGRAANIMLRADDELNVIGAEKLQDADEDAFVHEPETIHEPPLADPMTPEAFATVTLPVMETFEACVRRVALAPPSVSPPPIVRA